MNNKRGREKTKKKEGTKEIGEIYDKGKVLSHGREKVMVSVKRITSEKSGRGEERRGWPIYG